MPHAEIQSHSTQPYLDARGIKYLAESLSVPLELLQINTNVAFSCVVYPCSGWCVEYSQIPFVLLPWFKAEDPIARIDWPGLSWSWYWSSSTYFAIFLHLTVASCNWTCCGVVPRRYTHTFSLLLRHKTDPLSISWTFVFLESWYIQALNLQNGYTFASVNDSCISPLCRCTLFML